MSAHPAALGSALTHPHITTDFCESQVELITGVHASIDECLAELTALQRFTTAALGDDMLWASSMPCTLPPDDAIPVGQYGSSNVGRTKTIYRTGLGHRYGRRMQTISGIHYNWSLPGVSSDEYFGLIRNFRRHAFLLLYLFGASPAVCSSFVQGREHRLQALSAHTMGLPYATSLRMGRLGYQSDAQASLAVSYNGLAGYGDSLFAAMTRPYPPYEALGLRDAQGHYRQLATSLLQIENEFYGTIRPKRVIFPGERPLHALRERGVEYVEVRLMDLDPFETVGIQARTMRFLDVFLLHCLYTPSPQDSPQEIAALARNQQAVAERGREPGLVLERGAGTVTLQEWGQALLSGLAPFAAALDAAHGNTLYSESVADAQSGLDDPQRLPSARVLAAMTPYNHEFTAFVQARSQSIKDEMLATALAPGLLADYGQQARDSVQAQGVVEASDSLPFDRYLLEYLAPHRLQAKPMAAALV
jgi:glutamate--cysteine ligase